ncbi:acyltransferase [Parahaliea sp. F7430]|uniref:Acyltransferase n=1 Tax=Sediminihaliea albiluteola TaxID=2758564 RepID=A0A7W2YK64_9GAMM|nr:acyltransferase [Sediminihaliea albiluteola]MBA6414291.1 acyltransferase [Sediminihaliea albiluteola]
MQTAATTPQPQAWAGRAFSWLQLDAGLRAERSYLPELESLRGLAILLVYLFHCWGISGLKVDGAPNLALSFIISGNTGVTLFFVLSGFLLSLPWLKHYSDPQRPQPSVKRFYISRVIRILPMYYAALLFTFAVLGPSMELLKAGAFFFVGFDLFPYSVVWWTLSTEVQFYLALPLLMSLWLLKPLGRLLTGLLLLAWCAAYYYFVLSKPDINQAFPFFFTKSIFARLPAFLCGIFAAAIYVYLNKKTHIHLVNKVRTWALLCCAISLIALGLVLQKVASIGDQQSEATWHIHHFYESFLWSVILLSLVLYNFPGKRLIANLPLAILGKLSYSFYLTHVPILFYLIYPIKTRMGEAAYLDSLWLYAMPLIAMLLALGLSIFTYRAIELPFLNLKHKIAL